jgi:adenylate cyclase
MPKTEREWKFVVRRGPSMRGRDYERIEQGYLDEDSDTSVRVRIADRRAYLTIKAKTGDSKTGAKVRKEFEYEIPIRDARALLRRTEHRLRKRRYAVGRMRVDVFEGDLDGLVLVEVPTSKDGAEPDPGDAWKWKDVSHAKKYGNSGLAADGCRSTRRGRSSGDAPRLVGTVGLGPTTR